MWCLGRRFSREISGQLGQLRQCGTRRLRFTVILAAILCAAAICGLARTSHSRTISQPAIPRSLADSTLPEAGSTQLMIRTESVTRSESVLHTTPGPRRENACIIILCRNSDQEDLVQTLASLEERFNSKFHYPYVLLNDVPFTETFKTAIREAVNPHSSVTFGDIPESEWSIPEWINTTKMEEGMASMKRAGVVYGDSLSYRHMCRYNSGFFFRHPLVMQYDYYWRVEPGVKFHCNVDEDPFTFLRERSLKYTFVITLEELPLTIPTLWETTLSFQQSHALPEGHLDLFKDEKSNYNGCHYWSNFEIADMRFFRSQEYIDYFNYLDQAGGFYYERWGDAPVHSLGTALLLKPSEVHFFDMIGYEHHPFAHLPLSAESRDTGQCTTKGGVEQGGWQNGAASVLDFNGGGTCLKRWVSRWRGLQVEGNPNTLSEDQMEMLQPHPFPEGAATVN